MYASARKIDEQRDSGEILKQHATNDERHLRGPSRRRLPADERFDVLVSSAPYVLEQLLAQA